MQDPLVGECASKAWRPRETLEHSWNLNRNKAAFQASTCPFLTGDHFPLHRLLYPGRGHHPFCLWEYGSTQRKIPLQMCACWSFEVSSQAFSRQHLSLGRELVRTGMDGIEARGVGKERRKCHCFYLAGSSGCQPNIPVQSASDGPPVLWGPV